MRRYFGFHDVTVTAVDEAAGSFTAFVLVELGPFGVGSALEGRVVIGDGLVHTSLTLPPA